MVSAEYRQISSHLLEFQEEFLIFGYWVWLMSFSELKDRHVAATATVNTLRDRLNQKRQQLLDTDGGPVLSGALVSLD